MNILPILLLFAAFDLVQMRCLISQGECICKNIHLDNFLDEFYRILYSQEEISHNTVSSITVENFRGNYLKQLPKLPVIVRNLNMSHSELEVIADDAFRHFGDLEEFVLSGSLLSDLTFVRNLPFGKIKKLDLSRNRIRYINNIFQDFIFMYVLDLSYNFIEVLDMDFISHIANVNLNYNKLSRINPMTHNNQASNSIKNIQLAGNFLTSYNETELNCSFLSADVSYNNLSIIKITSEKNFFDLSGNSISQILNSGFYHPPNIDRLYLSSQGSDINPQNFDVKIHLVKMNNNRISKLSSCCFNLSHILHGSIDLPKIDISNSSITYIEESYFSFLDLKLLNLSYNALSVLTRQVFANSNITYLDISFNQINYIEFQVFEETRINFLNMSHNNIESIKYAFENIRSLTDLDLRFNKLYILESNSFYNLPITGTILLGYNNISTIKTRAFNSLENIFKINLLNNVIINLELNSFYKLRNVVGIDLGNNKIKALKNGWFYETPNLSKFLLTGNNVSDVYEISNEIELKQLNVTLTGILHSGKFMNTYLSELNIENSIIEALMPDCFDGLFNLISLHFDNSFIYTLHEGALNHLYRLEYLDAQNLFKFTKNVRRDTFKDLMSLKILNLSSLSLENIESYSFLGLKKLKELLLNNNKIAVIQRNTFIGLDTLKLLDLSYNEIRSLDQISFDDLHSLEELRLNNNMIYTLLEETFLGFARLVNLYINNNYLMEIPMGIFQNLTNLKYLNMSFNRLQNIRNGDLSNLRNLTILDLSNNNLTYIESESVFFPCGNLMDLRLDNNQLELVDFQTLVNLLPNLYYVGISFNRWKCDNLFSILEILKNFDISYEPSLFQFREPNIVGIKCRL